MNLTTYKGIWEANIPHGVLNHFSPTLEEDKLFKII
jgi:hypothetical protein